MVGFKGNAIKIRQVSVALTSGGGVLCVWGAVYLRVVVVCCVCGVCVVCVGGCILFLLWPNFGSLGVFLSVCKVYIWVAVKSFIWS